MQDSNFFPTEYKIPTGTNYMRFREGANTFRVLSNAVIGYEYFNTQNKPVRSKEAFEHIPSDMKKDGGIKHFWAFAVWNYDEKRIQILELTQKSIMQTMNAYIRSAKWGDPKEYDFVVNRTGAGLDTEYSVTVDPKSPLDINVKDKAKQMKLNLEALFEGKDPFSLVNEDLTSAGTKVPDFESPVENEINPDNIPF